MQTELNKELKHLELTDMNEKAENAVALAVAATAVTGVVPIPLADAPMMVGEQIALMASICAIYGINVKKEGLKMLAISALSAGGATVVGKTIASNLFKCFPGAGSVIGGTISAGTAGVVTLAMGKAFIEVCKMVKLGKLSEAELLSAKGKALFKDAVRKQIRHKD